MIDILEYLEGNSAIARYEFKCQKQVIDSWGWGGEKSLEGFVKIDRGSFIKKANSDNMHPLDLNEECWFEPLVHGISLCGSWDRVRDQ